MRPPSVVRILKALALTSILVLMTTESAVGDIIKIKNPWEKKKIAVTINHPATLGVSLKGKTVAFNPVGNDNCTQQFIDRVSQDFQANGVNLVDRSNLDAILTEHHFQMGASVDPATAVEFGRISGAALMVAVHVTRCTARQSPPLEEQQYVGPPIHVSRTEAHFQASIRTIDLTTGRVLGTNSVQSDPKKENRGQGELRPEYPPIEEIQDLAVLEASASVNRLYFPWVEAREVAFMDSKTCNLKQAYDLLKTGDLNIVIKTSIENVEQCKEEKPSHQADALYNLGVAYLLAREYDRALATLQESQRLHSDKWVIEAIAECNRAKATEADLAQQHIKEEKDLERVTVEKGKQERKAIESALTNESIIEFVKAGFREELLIKTIASKPASFSLSPQDLLSLKRAGVPDRVISAMLDKK